jgi:hypothetical protein
MFAGFGLLMPAGAMVARFCQSMSSSWFALHRGIQLLAVLLVAGSLALVIYKTNQQGSMHFDNTHARLGLAAACVALVQPFIAWLRPRKFGVGRAEWYVLHFTLGWGAVILGAAAIVLGLQRFGAAASIVDAYYGYLGLLTVAILLLSIATRGRSEAQKDQGTKGGELDVDPLLS